MCNELDEVLYRVGEEVLASLAFMLPVPPEEASEHTDESGPRTWTASVPFIGRANGSLMLVVSEEMLPQLAANMLGLPEGGDEASPDQQRDALLELANVICGNLLTEIWGSEVACTLSPPRLLGQDVPVKGPTDGPPAATARIELVEGRAELSLFVDEEPGTAEVTPASVNLTDRIGRE